MKQLIEMTTEEIMNTIQDEATTVTGRFAGIKKPFRINKIKLEAAKVRAMNKKLNSQMIEMATDVLGLEITGVPKNTKLNGRILKAESELAAAMRKRNRERIVARAQVTQSREFLKSEGILHTAAQIMEKLIEAPGLGMKTKNYQKITAAMVQGHDLIEILNDPTIAGIAAVQKKYFTQFLQENKVADRLFVKTRTQVHVPVGSALKMAEHDGKLYSAQDYSRADGGYKMMSETVLSELFGESPTHIRFYKMDPSTGKRVLDDQGKPVIARAPYAIPMHNLMYVDFHIEGLPEDPADYTNEDHELVAKRKRMVKDGFYYIGRDNKEHKMVFLLWSASGARSLQGVFIREDFMSPVEAYKLMGHEAIAYAKNKDGEYVLDVTKLFTRFGLAGTNSVASNVVKLGNTIENINETEYRITGGTHSMRVIEDRFTEVKAGHYFKWDATNQKFKKFDAKEHPITLGVGDGLVYCDEEIYHTLNAEFGDKADAWQIRITPFVKGLMVFVPGLRNFYGDSIVATKSAVKGDYRELFKQNPEYGIQLRIAMFNKEIHKARPYTNMPYQFLNASSLNASHIWTVMLPHLKDVAQALHDKDIIKRYVGAASAEKLENLTDEEYQHALESSKSTTLATFLHEVDWSYDDVQMKRMAIKHLRQKLEDWKQGTVPVQGHYRYMVQDPYAILHAGTTYTKRDDQGRLLVKEHKANLQANQVFINPTKHAGKVKKAALGRNPMVAKGEWGIVNCVYPRQYANAVATGAFRNLCVMSVHDFVTFGMGGADNDGDTCLVMTEPSLVEVLHARNNHAENPPIMDMSFTADEDGNQIEDLGDGCPYPLEDKDKMKLDNLHLIPTDMVVKQKDYKITFTAEQYTDELFAEIRLLALDFVGRSLEPNKIGLATNIATILADGIRGLGYEIASNNVNPEWAMSKIDEWENMIMILRLVQGWEIDRAKHGGLYEIVMADTLAFMTTEIPVELSRETKSGRVWQKPDWLAARKGQADKAPNRGSVLSQVRQNIIAFEEQYLNQELQAMEVAAVKCTIRPKLEASINPDNNLLIHVQNQIKPIKAEYGQIMKQLSDKENMDLNQITAMANVSDDDKALRYAAINKMTSEAKKTAADNARFRIRELSNQYGPVLVGYAAYLVTYHRMAVDQSYGFVWNICTEAFIQTLLYVDNKANADQVVTGDIQVQMSEMHICVPSDVQETFQIDQVGRGLVQIGQGGGVWIQVNQNWEITINGKYVGFVYDRSAKALRGHNRYQMKAQSFRLSEKSKHSLTLEYVTVVKA